MSISAILPELARGSAVDKARERASRGLPAMHRFIADPKNRSEIERALCIRAVESALYEAFGQGKLHGTIHTCIGQEFSGAILGRYLESHDFVTSNHRCHGHFIGATDDWRGLVDEIVGNPDGVCAGIGSSQHLWARNFISNGQQGGLLPVGAGVALDRKLKGDAGVVVSFLGEGTLGEGILYETLNLASLWALPQVFICENNFYSQSTRQELSVAGDIAERAASFDIASRDADTWDLAGYDAILADAMGRARAGGGPTFITLATYRLNPHSKGDDLRDRAEIDWFRAHDPATLAARTDPHFTGYLAEVQRDVAAYVEAALRKTVSISRRYFEDQRPRPAEGAAWSPVPGTVGEGARIAQQLNRFYTDWLAGDPTACFLGEDVEDPYGGAFKIAKGLTSAFPDRVRTTPISEAAITGIGIGLAITGRRALVEIMFGDFITYAFDQIVNNASKMHHMYDHNLDCPVVIRTPMGGRRGYGPTHSQSLERFLIGIDNCCTVSLNSIVDVRHQLAALQTLSCPVILLENKGDYAARVYPPPTGVIVEGDGGTLPMFRIRPADGDPTVTLLAYGGMARFVADGLLEIFDRTDTVPELIVPTGLTPLNLGPIAESVGRTGRLVIVEEGAGFGSFGAEVLSQLLERGCRVSAGRVSGKAVPIPSAPALEAATLPSLDEICAMIETVKGRTS